jgi:ribosomal protein L7Ae-like RNA K-turn-binding protein
VVNKLFSMLGLARRAGKLTAGTDACLNMIKKGKAQLVITASNASENTKSKFRRICENEGIKYYEIGEIEILSKSIGLENKAVICVTDNEFTKAIVEIIGKECIHGGEHYGEN